MFVIKFTNKCSIWLNAADFYSNVTVCWLYAALKLKPICKSWSEQLLFKRTEHSRVPVNWKKTNIESLMYVKYT